MWGLNGFRPESAARAEVDGILSLFAGTISRSSASAPNPWCVLSNVFIILFNPWKSVCKPSRSVVTCTFQRHHVAAASLWFSRFPDFPCWLGICCCAILLNVWNSVTVHLLFLCVRNSGLYLFSVLRDIKALPVAQSRLQTWIRSHFWPWDWIWNKVFISSFITE